MNDNNEKNKRTFKELWHDKQMHAIIVLGIWFAFFTLIFLFLGIASLFSSPKNSNTKKNEETPQIEQVEANIPKMLENLIASNYNFEIIINDKDNNKYSYNGSKEDESVKGYYESSSGIIKYTIKDEVYYQIDGDDLIENNNIISEEDKNIVNINNILEEIKDYELDNEVLKEDNAYVYKLREDKKITITTNNNDIEKIIIEFNNKNYTMSFKNINE